MFNFIEAVCHELYIQPTITMCYLVHTSTASYKKLVPWGTDGRLPLSDLDLGSGHTAYHRASLIDLYLYQISLRSEENFFESHH